MSKISGCDDKETLFKIRTNSKCKIFNKDPKKTQDLNSIMSYSLDKGQTVNKSKLSATQYKLLEALASANDCDIDDDINILTLKDLQRAKERLNTSTDVFKDVGIKEFRYDSNAGVVNITAKNGEVLRVDFGLNSKPIYKTKTKKATTVPDKYAGIPKKWIPYIQSTAKKYGYSEELIITIALSEGFTKKSTFKKEGGGLYEVGFGHTTRANHNNKFSKNFEIDLNTAFDWLGQDIKDKEEKIKNFGNHYNYDKIPKPLKEMMIDVAFNRGEARLNPNLKLSIEEKEKGKKQKYDDHYDSAIANIQIESWGAAAVRFRQEEFPKYIITQGKEGGLRKRNVQRFLKLMSYLKPEKIVGAMDLFNREYYYTKTLSLLKQPEADSLRAQWNSIYYNAKAKCTK